ncbi:hypothetical protein B0H14DRAFT_2654766 [Mycena olivaceomarginata]|nr:hypothetical protein B0H14DRAFT_2654766 [Mycena olivaceomarginata]
MWLCSILTQCDSEKCGTIGVGFEVADLSDEKVGGGKGKGKGKTILTGRKEETIWVEKMEQASIEGEAGKKHKNCESKGTGNAEKSKFLPPEVVMDTMHFTYSWPMVQSLHWITHLLGGKGTTACVHVTDAAWKEACIHKDLEDAKVNGRSRKRSASAQLIAGEIVFAAEPSTLTSGPRHGGSASGADEPVSKWFKQGSFQVFTGRD